MMMIKLVKSGSQVEEYVNAEYIARFKVDKVKGVTEVEFTKDSGLTNISVNETPDEIMGLVGGKAVDFSSKHFSGSKEVPSASHETPDHHSAHETKGFVSNDGPFHGDVPSGHDTASHDTVSHDGTFPDTASHDARDTKAETKLPEKKRK